MRASPQLSQARESHLSEQSLALLHGLLLAEADTQAARSAAHEALISQLRDLTDADSFSSVNWPRPATFGLMRP